MLPLVLFGGSDQKRVYRLRGCPGELHTDTRGKGGVGLVHGTLENSLPLRVGGEFQLLTTAPGA